MGKAVWLRQKFDINLPVWTVIMPVLAGVLLLAHFVWHPTAIIVQLVTGGFLMGAVFAAVHHAEVIAHKVGEPFGTLVLALAVTVIEVALIVALMNSSTPADAAVLARDTVFAAVMIICNGIIGICLLIGGVKNYVQRYSLHGSKAAVSILLMIALLVFILPNFTLSMAGGGMLNSQLLFVAACCLILYTAFIFKQTIRHRDYFTADGEDDEHHSDNAITTSTSIGLLIFSLITVVGLAKMLSPTIETGLISLGLPKIVLGIIIAGLVLLPESIAAVKAAYHNQLQNSINLGLGSALASISLTIPVIVIYSIVMGTPVVFGLNTKDSVMLFITLLITINTLSTGRTTFLYGVIHLVMLATFLFFSIVP